MPRQFPTSATVKAGLRLARRLSRSVVVLSTLTAFVAGTIGIPIGNAAGGNSLQAGSCQCRCTAQDRTAGACCCTQRAAAEAKRSCCGGPKSPAQTCVIATGQSEPVACKSKEEPGEHPVLKSCPCGGFSTSTLLLCGEPRILDRGLTLEDACSSRDRFVTACLLAPQHIVTPDTPPPKSHSC